MKTMKLSDRIIRSWRDPYWRTNALALVGGKAIGLSLLLAMIYVFLPPALHAQAGAPSPEINALNTVWVLLAAFLVFCMVSCCDGAELQMVRSNGDGDEQILLRELYPDKSTLYERARELQSEAEQGTGV